MTEWTDRRMRRLLVCAACCGLAASAVSGCASDSVENTTALPSIEVSSSSSSTLPESSTTSAGTSQAPPVTPEQTSTTEALWDQTRWLNEEAPEAIAVVESFYAALNTGEKEAIGDLSPGFLATAGARTLPIAVAGAGARFDVHCLPDLDAPQVICDERVTDDLYGPAGITHHRSVRYTVIDRRLVVEGFRPPFVCSADPEGSAQRFLLDFHEWSVTAHPETARRWEWGTDNTAISIPCTPYPFRTTEGATEICSQLDEFLAQSEEWPPEAVVAWEELATRMELLARDALAQAELINAAMDELPNEALSEAGWFESCCADPRDDLAAILSDISTELVSFSELLPDLGDGRAPEASRYLENAAEGIDKASQLLEYGIEAAGRSSFLNPSSARSMVEDGLPTIIEHTILGCVRACVID
jgi:hypothetical protein